MNSSMGRAHPIVLTILFGSSAATAGCTKLALVEEAAAAPITESRDAGAAQAGGTWIEPPLERPKRRPQCRRPPPILHPDNIGYLDTLSKSAQHWSLVRYVADNPDGGTGENRVLSVPNASRGAEFASSDYFSGLKPAKRARIYPAGFAKVSAVRARYELMDSYKTRKNEDEARTFGVENPNEFRPAWTGVLSDHCLEVAPNDPSLVFSLLLTDKLVVQAIAERTKPGQFVTDTRPSGTNGRPGNEPIPDRVYADLPQEDCMWRSITSIQLRVVRLGGREPVVVSETPKVTLGDAKSAANDYELPYMQGELLGDTPDAPVVIGLTHGYAVAVITRDGKIPVFRKNLCARSYRGLGVKFWREHIYSGDRSYQLFLAPLSGSFEPGKDVDHRCNEDEDAINVLLKGIAMKKVMPAQSPPK